MIYTFLASMDMEKRFLEHRLCVCVYVRGRYNDGLGGGRPGFYFRQGQYFSFLHRVQTSSGAHQASHPTGTGGTFPGGEAAGE
jgi:hypothetical protein